MYRYCYQWYVATTGRTMLYGLDSDSPNKSYEALVY